MNRQPFSSRDWRFTAAIVAIIAVCFVYIRLEYDKAFPQASIQLRLSKAEITNIARNFLASRGFSADGFRELTIFNPDEDARLYLEREVGLERANQLMQGQVAVWRWRARWFRPPQQEEWFVWASPSGDINGFEHVIPEAAPGAKLTRDQAFGIAASFLHTMTTAPMHLVEDRLQQKPNRNDYVFTWEQDGFRAKDATYRRSIVVQGDRAGRYTEYLYVPEAWQREFAGMRSKNDLYASIAQAAWLPLVLAALVLLVRGLRRHLIPWRPLMMIAGTVGALMILNQLNSIPLLVDQFPTSSPYAQTLFLVILQSLGTGVGVFFYVIVAGAAGAPTYREEIPDPLPIQRAFTWDGFASRRYYHSVLAGYGLAAAHIAFLVAFYLIGRRFGAWSPQDVQYSDLLSTAMPWIYPVAIASMAASAEEFWFRLLAIPLLSRLLKIRWIAVIIPAFVWGFLHANYPQQPAWIRGVEVGLIGVAAGFMMLRFGILSTLVWHYTVDAVLIGSNLFSATSWFFRLNGGILALFVLAPVLVSVVLYRRNRGFVELEELAETAAPPAETPPPEPLAPAPVPIWRPQYLYAAAVVVGLLAIFLGPHIYGSWITIQLNRTEAAAIASRNIPDPAQWRAVSDFITNLDSAEYEYLRRNAGTEGAESIVQERKPVAVWVTRFLRPLTKEEWRVYIGQQGEVLRRDHLLDEKAPGARLTPEQARTRAQLAVPGAYSTVVDSSQDRRDNRIDYTFVFEDPSFHAGDARARSSVELHGAEPSNLRRFIKLPEEWLRDFRKPSLSNFAVPALFGSAGMPLLILFIRRLGSHETVFHWRAYTIAGGLALIASAAASANQWTNVLIGYDTATPLRNYLTQYVLGRATLIVLTSVAVLAVVLAMDVFRQAAIGRAALNRPSLLRACAVAVLIAGLNRVLGWTAGAVPGPQKSLPLWSIGGIDTTVPGLLPVTQAYLTSILAVGIGAMLVFAVIRYMGLQRRIIAACLLAAAVAWSQSLTVLQFVEHGAAVFVWLAVVFLIVRTCASDLIGLAVAVFWVVALNAAGKLAMQPAMFLRVNGIVAIVVAVLIGLVALQYFRRAGALAVGSG